MRIVSVTQNRKLLELLGSEAARLNWDLHNVSDLSGEPDLILADPKDARVQEWWKKGKLIGQPMVLIRLQPAELRATFDRIERLKGQRHFPKYNLYIDSERQVARVGTKRLVLTITELRLLRELAGMTFDAVARDALEEWVFASRGNRRTLDVHICSLRKKLKSTGLLIESVRGVGYRLNPCSP